MESGLNFKKPKAIAASVASTDIEFKRDAINNWVNEDYSMEEQYRNFFNYDIVVIDINNNAVHLKPQRRVNPSEPHLSILREYEWEAQTKFDVNTVPADDIDISDESLSNYQLNYAKMVNKLPTRALQRTVQSLDIRLYQGTFNKNNKVVFIRELGIVVTTPQLLRDHKILNPLSREAQLLKEASDALKDAPAPFVFRIFANVPDGVSYGTRYMNINDRVYKVPSIVDPTLDEGVYVTTNIEPEGIEYQIDELLFQKVPLVEADKKLHLYPTIAGARNHHSTVAHEQAIKLANSEREIHELKLQNTKLKEISEARKNDNNIDYLVRSNELKAELEALKSRYDALALERKDKYESSHYNRKNTSETIGWIPKIIAGVVAATVAAVGVFAWFF